MPSLRAAIARAVLGLPTSVQNKHLVLRCGSRNGCGGVLGVLWLLGWTAMLSAIFRDVWSKRDLYGFVLFAALGGVTAIIAAFIVRSSLPGEELRVEGDKVILRRRRRLFYAPVRVVNVADVTNITMLGVTPATASGTGQFIVIEAGEARIIFGRGTDAFQLALWARLLRSRVQTFIGRALPADAALERFEAERRQRQERIQAQALAAVGARSVTELTNDPARQQAAVRKARELTIAEMCGITPAAKSPTSLLGQIVRWLVAAVFLFIMVPWILGVVGLTIQALQHPRVVMILVLPILWVPTLFFLYAIFSVIKSAVVGVMRWLKRLAFGTSPAPASTNVSPRVP
jgi:hypothetical protein